MPRKSQRKKSSHKGGKLYLTILFIVLFLTSTIFYFVNNSLSKNNSLLDSTLIQNSNNISTLHKITNQLMDVEYSQNSKVAMNQLKKLLANNTIANECHGITHIIGNNAYLKYKDINKALTYYDEMCGSGYIHGIIEQRFADIKNDAEVYKILPTI